MGSILQLNPPILVETPLGRGDAIFIIDYGIHQNTCWIVALLKDGIIKHFDSNDVIMAPNYTYHLNMEKKNLIKDKENLNGNGVHPSSNGHHKTS